MTERRYSEDEVEAIFRAATERAEPQALTAERGGGLALSDLQDIAREVGISTDAVTRAARSLGGSSTIATKTVFGIPFAVSRTVQLDRNLTEPEWELLVVQLRQMFNARGSVRVQGTLRQWSNGNLYALLEPTTTGFQLRLGTAKREARSSLLVGAMALVMAAFLGFTGVEHGTLRSILPAVIGLTVGGAIFAGNIVLRLPAWARIRQRQMDAIADDVQSTTRNAIAEPRDAAKLNPLPADPQLRPSA